MCKTGIILFLIKNCHVKTRQPKHDAFRVKIKSDQNLYFVPTMKYLPGIAELPIQLQLLQDI